MRNRSLVEIAVLVLVLFAAALSAGDQGVKYEPPACDSNVYRWTGEQMVCVAIDRVDLLTSQRDVNEHAYAACRAQVTLLQAARVLTAKEQAAKEKCRELGRVFDPQKVECGDPLPQKESEDHANQ